MLRRRPRLGSFAALPGVAEKPDPRVPWPDALRVLDFIAASLHSHPRPSRQTAAVLPCYYSILPIPWEGLASGILMTLIIAIRASK